MGRARSKKMMKDFFEASLGFSEIPADEEGAYEKNQAALLSYATLRNTTFGERAFMEITLPSCGKAAQLAPVPNVFVAPIFRSENCIFAVGDLPVYAGTFYEASVSELRLMVKVSRSNLSPILISSYCVPFERLLYDLCAPKGLGISVTNMCAESRFMHHSATHSVVQVASQFNYLEFPDPTCTPNAGITSYREDPTQGAACAMACAAGTAYRNYLVHVPRSDGTCQRGQTKDEQLNALRGIEVFMGKPYWQVTNGYIESTDEALDELNATVLSNPHFANAIKSRLMIGIQKDTQVTSPYDILIPTANNSYICQTGKYPHFVTQTYNSAVGIAYSQCNKASWVPLAKLILEASYEATLLVGALNTLRWLRAHADTIDHDGMCARITITDLPAIFLTKIGTGVFGNDDSWVQEAITKACERVSSDHRVPLNVKIVHYGNKVDPGYTELSAQINGREK